MKLNWNFQRGGGIFCEGGMDIFWNYTLAESVQCDTLIFTSEAGGEPRQLVKHWNFLFCNFCMRIVFLIIQVLEKAGFVDVKAIDNIKRFIEVLTSERARFETDKNTSLKVWELDVFISRSKVL